MYICDSFLYTYLYIYIYVRYIHTDISSVCMDPSLSPPLPANPPPDLFAPSCIQGGAGISNSLSFWCKRETNSWSSDSRKICKCQRRCSFFLQQLQELVKQLIYQPLVEGRGFKHIGEAYKIKHPRCNNCQGHINTSANTKANPAGHLFEKTHFSHAWAACVYTSRDVFTRA